ETAEQALTRLRETAIDLVVTDLRLPVISGLDLLRDARQAGLEFPVIVITAYGTVEDAVAAMKLGAFDFLTKPFSHTDLVHLAKRALEERGGDGETLAAGARDGSPCGATFDQPARPLAP